MKKLLLSISLIGIFWGFVSMVSASNTSCKDVEFANGVTACVNIEDAGTNRRELTTEIDGGSTSNFRCDIMTPDSRLRSISSCNGEFTYDVEKAGRIKLWIRYSETAPSDREGKPSSNSERTYPQWIYDFDNQERANDNLDDSSSSSSSYDADNFYITTDDSTPSTTQRVDLKVKARDGTTTDTEYDGDIVVSVYYKTSSTSTIWNEAPSSYYDIDADYDSEYEDWIAFSSSWKGYHVFSDFIKFKKNYYFKVVVEDTDDSDIDGYYDSFKASGTSSSSSSYDADNFYITTDDSTPSTTQRVDLKVKARDGTTTDTEYDGDIVVSVYYKTSSTSTIWNEAPSSYYDIDADYDSEYEDWIAFSSSWKGYHVFSDFIKFKKNYYFKVVVEDTDDNDIDGYYDSFKASGTSSSSSNGDLDNFYLTTDDTTPTTSQYVDLTVKARDSSNDTVTNYRDSVNFKVYYCSASSCSSSSSSDRHLISSSNASTYYTMNSSYTDGYDFTSSNAGQKTFSSFIKFKKNNYSYKVQVYDENDTSIYKEIIFNLGSSSSSSSSYNTDNFYITTDDSTPSTSQYVDLTVKARDGTNTDTTYRGTVQFEVYYRSSSSSSRTLTTSPTYYTMNSTYSDGYTFTSSNAGQKTFTDLIKFNKNNYSYKVLVYDEDDENIDEYKEFTVGSSSSSSSVNGFTSSEFTTVENIYSSRDDMITNLENQYSKLKSSTRRQTMSDDLRAAMREIINDNSSKTYDTFDEFYAAFLDRYRYTISIR